MNKLHEHSQPKQIQFNNNPFSLAFNGMSKAFTINQNPAILIIVGAASLAIANQIFGNVPGFLGDFGDSTGNDGLSAALTIMSVLFFVIYMPVSIFVSTLWTGFVSLVGMSNAKDESLQIKSGLRRSLSKFWTVFGINFIIGLVSFALLIPAMIAMITGGVLAGTDNTLASTLVFILSAILAIGGMFMAIRYSLARALSTYAVFDENLSFSAAMNRSVKLTKGRLIEVWGMGFPGIVPFAGPLLATCGLGAHFLQLKTYRDNSADMPKIHILSWLPLMLIGALALFVLLVAGLILLIVASR
jgi:hypothetical protein